MKGRNNKAGLTLLEMMATLLILVLLVSAVGAGMGAAQRVYRAALFESNSAAMAEILNTALADVLGFGLDVTGEGEVFCFTNLDYGLQAGWLEVAEGMLYLRQEGGAQLLVNTGVYPELEIQNFRADHVPAESCRELILQDGSVVQTQRGGYIYITYDIVSTQDAEKRRTVETLVRLVNAQ